MTTTNQVERKNVVNIADHAADDVLTVAALSIRRRPLQAVAAAIVVGVIAGTLIAVGAGRSARKRG
jgi:hypothetical protein